MRPTVSCPSVLATVAAGLCAGLLATLVTNLAQRPLKAVTPDRVELHERRIRPDETSSLMAARKLGGVLRISLTEGQEASLGMAIHYSTGAAWGPVYGLLRRYGRLRPASAAVASGVGMSLLLDELLVPALGLSAPSRDYPLFTRARGVVAHLVYGAVVALAAEGLGRLMQPARALS